MKKKIFLTLILIAYILPITAIADQTESEKFFPAKTFSLFFENDAFFGTDKEYTNGIRFSMLLNDNPYKDSTFQKFIKNTVRKAGMANNENTKFAYSISIGQNIYTPENTESIELVKNDRPYAGVTYLAAGIITQTKRTMNTLEFSLGIIGEHSYAEDVQKSVHETFDWDKPKGWGNQLKDEPLIQMFYAKRWKASKGIYNGFGFDIIPEISAGAGNVLTYVQAGVSFRAGFNIPNDFGTPRIRPATDTNFPLDKNDPRLFPRYKRFGVYLFCTANSEYVLRNLFLDGSSFRDSHSVDKYPVTGATTIGGGLIIHRFNIIYGYVFKSKEYKEQSERSSYGTISISYSW